MKYVIIGTVSELLRLIDEGVLSDENETVAHLKDVSWKHDLIFVETTYGRLSGYEMPYSMKITKDETLLLASSLLDGSVKAPWGEKTPVYNNLKELDKIITETNQCEHEETQPPTPVGYRLVTDQERRDNPMPECALGKYCDQDNDYFCAGWANVAWSKGPYWGIGDYRIEFIVPKDFVFENR